MPGGAMPGLAHFEGLSSALLSATKCRLPPKLSSASLRGAAEEGQSNGRGTSFSFGAMPSSGGRPGKRLFSLPHAAGTALPESWGTGTGQPVLGTPRPAAPHPHGLPLPWQGTSALSGLVSACHLVEGARTASPCLPCSILCRPHACSTGGCSKKGEPGDTECPSTDHTT